MAVISDDFEDGSINAAWIEVDPGGIATWSEASGKLSVATTGGGDAYNAPAANSRMVQLHDDTDFDIEAIWEIPSGHADGVGLWFDDGTNDEYFRWDLRMDTTNNDLWGFAAHRVGGTYTSHKNASTGDLTTYTENVLYMRLRRSGTTVTCEYKKLAADPWSSYGSFTSTVNANRIGIHAVSGSDIPSIGCHSFTNNLAGSGTELTQNSTDDTNLSDTETVALNYTLADTDTITLQDQVTYNTRHIRQDNVWLSDSFTVTKQIAPSATDSLSLGEQIQMQLDMVMNRTDSLSLSDPVDVELAMQKAQTDTLALTDITAIELGKFVLLTESIGLTDFTTFIQKTELTESTGLVDQVTTALLYLNGFLDLADITDSYTIELYNNGAVSLTELLGISDTFTITLGGSVSMSLADQVMAWLTGLGYTTGSIQDRQYQFLLDRYTTNFGAPPYSLTTSDLQAALGEKVRLVLKESEYTP